MSKKNINSFDIINKFDKYKYLNFSETSLIMIEKFILCLPNNLNEYNKFTELDNFYSNENNKFEYKAKDVFIIIFVYNGLKKENNISIINGRLDLLIQLKKEITVDSDKLVAVFKYNKK